MPLGGSGVSLWWAPLDVPPAVLHDLQDVLSPAELQRAERFQPRRERERFVAARGWLRRLLGHQLRRPPGEVAITTDDRGKPRLSSSELFFNASRSAGTALYVTSADIAVGVDIELIDPVTDMDGVARRFFSPAEQRALAALPPEARKAAHFECWTFKEAYLKGLGVGLTVPLRELQVWAGPGRSSPLSGWSVHRVELAPAFAAAVAAADAGAGLVAAPSLVPAGHRHAQF